MTGIQLRIVPDDGGKVFGRHEGDHRILGEGCRLYLTGDHQWKHLPAAVGLGRVEEPRRSGRGGLDFGDGSEELTEVSVWLGEFADTVGDRAG